MYSIRQGAEVIVLAGSRRPTVRDIAQAANVSPSTVSAALRPPGHGATISDETRQRVLQVAEDIGYDHSRLRSQPNQPTTVAVLCPASTHPNVPMLYPFLIELSERMAHNGLRMLLESGHGVSSGPDHVEALFRAGAASAAVGVAMGQEWAACASEWGVPAVFLGPATADTEICSVSVDDEAGGRLVGQHLRALGHVKVGIIHMYRGVWGDARRAGLVSVWCESGLKPPLKWIRTLDNPSTDAVEAAVHSILDASHDGGAVTALFCDADWVASHALRVIRAMGLRVPEDVSVIGFDDAHYATIPDPPLTTVRQPVTELCALAVQLLLEQLHLGEPITRHYCLPCELVVRGSTGLAPEVRRASPDGPKQDGAPAPDQTPGLVDPGPKPTEKEVFVSETPRFHPD